MNDNSSHIIAIVSTFPPMKCGIAVYAHQMFKTLQIKGNHIDRISVNNQNQVEKSLNLCGCFNCLKLIYMFTNYKRIIINYHRSFFFQKHQNKLIEYIDITLTNLFLSLAMIIGGKKIEVICHEVDYIHEKSSGFRKKFLFYIERLKWFSISNLFFHTTIEQQKFINYYGEYKNTNIQIISHNHYFYKLYNGNLIQARKNQNIDCDVIMFLCIGFINSHKGLDKIITSFSLTHSKNACLYIVGSVKEDNLEAQKYLTSLQNQAKNDKRIKLIIEYVSDEIFDEWIVASNYIVLPYSYAWSSGVIERANLYNKPCLVANKGGLPEQANPDSILFSSQEELNRIVTSIIE